MWEPLMNIFCSFATIYRQIALLSKSFKIKTVNGISLRLVNFSLI